MSTGSEWQSVGRHNEAYPLGPAAAPGRAGCMAQRLWPGRGPEERSEFALNRLPRGRLGGPPSPPATALNGSVVSGPTRPPGPDRLPQSSRRLRRGLAAAPTARTGSARRSGERPLTGRPPRRPPGRPPLGKAGPGLLPTLCANASLACAQGLCAYNRPSLRARTLCAYHWPCLRTGTAVGLAEGLWALRKACVP